MSCIGSFKRQMRPDKEKRAWHKENRRQINKDARRPGSNYNGVSVITMRDGRRYRAQDDGSLKVINKPRSRVKRLREERSKVPPPAK